MAPEATLHFFTQKQNPFKMLPKITQAFRENSVLTISDLYNVVGVEKESEKDKLRDYLNALMKHGVIQKEAVGVYKLTPN